MTADIDIAISDFAAGALLRYFRPGTQVEVQSPRTIADRDRELLRGHWALSAPVRILTRHLLLHRHETQALLVVRPRIDDAMARGRIDARATALHRIRTGTSTAIVAQEPVRSFDTGPNQVLAWVVYSASQFAARLQSLQPPGSAYSALTESVMAQLNQVRRLDALRDALRSPAVRRRPADGVLRDAARSRRVVYRLAVEAYNALAGVEAGEETAIRTVVNSTLIGPLEAWRRFELATAIAIGEALAKDLNKPFSLALLANDPTIPILTCGPFALYWQQSTSLYQMPAMEPSEAIVDNILSAYGVGTGADRPDLVLVDSTSARVVAVIEVKYLAADTATVRFREAVEQIVRYGRGYARNDELTALLKRSLVAMSVEAPSLIHQQPAGGVPIAIDFSRMKQGLLRAWAGTLH